MASAFPSIFTELQQAIIIPTCISVNSHIDQNRSAGLNFSLLTQEIRHF